MVRHAYLLALLLAAAGACANDGPAQVVEVKEAWFNLPDSPEAERRRA